MLDRPRFASPVVAAICAVSILSACGDDETTTSGGADGAAAAKSQSAAEATALAPYLKRPTALARELPPLDRAPAEGKTIYYISTGGDPTADYGQWLKQAAAVLGWKYKLLTYSFTNPASGNSAYLTAVNSGADAIVSVGLPAVALQAGIAAANAKDVPVVLLSSSDAADSEGFDQVGNVRVTAPTWGKVIAEGIEADARTKGRTAHVGVVTSTGIPALEVLTQAMVDGVEEHCSKCTVDTIDVPAADFASGQSSKSVISFVQRNPETNYVNALLGIFEVGTRPALDGAGFEDVEIVGLVPGPAQNKQVQEGESLFWVQFPVQFMSWAVVDSFARSFTGGDSSIHNDEQLPVWLVNESNADFDPSELPDFPSDYRERFTQLWKGR